MGIIMRKGIAYGGSGGAGTAETTTYDNSISGLDASNVQEAVDQLSSEIANLVITGGGITSDQRKSLIAIINAIGVFNVANGQELLDDFNSAWVVVINATGITLDKTVLSFEVAVSQSLTATVEPENSTDTVVWSSSDDSIAMVVNGVVTPISNGSCTITATVGSVSASCEVAVNVESEIVTYTITNNLTNASTDNPVVTITENGSYIATLTPDTDYEFDSVVVTMGGEDITDTAYLDGTINITAVTGNVVITASAVQSGSTEEITLLKSIKGDGASYVDTEVFPEKTHRYEISFTLSGAEYKYLFGVDCYAYGSEYYGVYVGTTSSKPTATMSGRANVNVFNGVGSWNTTENNLLTNKQAYFVMKDGKQDIYLDAEYTKQQTNYTPATSAWGDADMPPYPLYLFTVNDQTTNTEYSPGEDTLFWFKVYDDSTNELLHEFVPAKQGSKTGMYDTVTEKFHENKGTGTFSYEELEVTA